MIMEPSFTSTRNTRPILKHSLKFIRSDVPLSVTEAERERLLQLDITVIVDLRTDEERAEKECPLIRDSRFSCYCLPVAGGNTVPGSPDEVPASYIRMADENLFRTADLMCGVTGNVLYFRSAGKDRTGVLSAVLLHRLGQSREAIVADYLLSRDNLEPMLREYARQNPAIDLNVILPQRRYMEEFLTWLEQAHPDRAAGGTLRYISLREMPQKMPEAARWFSGKWRVPESAYLACMEEYLSGRTELGWYLCLDGESIVGGLGVIENDFHDRQDLTPNVCAVYTEESHRRRGIAGTLLSMAVGELKAKGISPVYLLTDHTGFYERYGWEFFCMVRGDGEEQLSRMYIHK